MKRICLGKITGTHGVKGLVKILPYGEEPKRLQELSPLYTSETGSETLAITLKNAHGKTWLAAIEGIENREEAQNLNGVELWTDRTNLPDIQEKNAYYISDLIGLTIVDENGDKVGIVNDIANFGAGDILDIKVDQGSDQGDDFMIPFTDDYIPDINLEDKIITIKKPEIL